MTPGQPRNWPLTCVTDRRPASDLREILRSADGLEPLREHPDEKLVMLPEARRELPEVEATDEPGMAVGSDLGLPAKDLPGVLQAGILPKALQKARRKRASAPAGFEP